MEFIDKISLEYQQRIKGSQAWLADELITLLGNSLDLKAGKIVTNAANYSKVYLLDKLYQTFIQKQQIPLFKWFAERTMDILGGNRKYFEKFAKTEAAFLSIDKQVQQEMLDIIGYDGKAFVKGGFLHDLATATDPIRSIKAQAISAVARGESFGEFSKNLKDKINGVNGANGIYEHHLRTATYDTFSEFERISANKNAVLLDLNYAIYGGTLITTSRPFCTARQGKVFTRKEIESWKNLSFDGKPTTGYNPFTQLGGYGCRHKLDWIDETAAKVLEPDKFENILN